MLANPVNKDDLSDYKEMKFIFEKSIVSASAQKGSFNSACRFSL